MCVFPAVSASWLDVRLGEVVQGEVQPRGQSHERARPAGANEEPSPCRCQPPAGRALAWETAAVPAGVEGAADPAVATGLWTEPLLNTHRVCEHFGHTRAFPGAN